MYIVLEWSVGVGKTTQIQLLVEYLQHQYPDRHIVSVREPGSTIIAQEIRQLAQATDFDEIMDPMTSVYLYAAARAQLLATVVKPALQRGAIVLSDRSFISSMAFQGMGQWVGIQTIWDVNRPIVHDCLPDQILYLDLPIDSGLSRTFDAQGDKYEREDHSFFESVHQWYRELMNHPVLTDRWTTIDASGEISQVQEEMRKQVDKLLLR
jgi:dTMP kinase